MDDSCYITLKNELNSTIDLSSCDVLHGDWVKSPPNRVNSKASSDIHLKDNFGLYGAEGSFSFKISSSPSSDPVSIKTSFGCPFTGDNYVKVDVTNKHLFNFQYRAKAGDSDSWSDNSCPERGHPLTIEYTLSYVNIVTTTAVSEIRITGDYTIQNSSGSTISYDDPIWTKSGSYTDGKYSTNPVLLKVGGTKSMNVTLVMDDAMSDVPFKLTGYLGETLIASSLECKGALGKKTIPVTLSVSEAMPSQCVGDVIWKLTIVDSPQVITLPKPTRLELYWIYGKPVSMYSRGVWVSVLRNIFPQILNMPNKDQVVTGVVNSCFTGLYDGAKKQYDCARGAPHYGTNWEGGYIDLKLYYSKLETYCNCYDQAGIVQVSLGALGISSDWGFLQPCGFINETNLIGWGRCNNPFFNGDEKKKILAINDCDRTMFGNHAFIVSSGQVSDACQGPYTATKAIGQYITDSIDTKTTLYADHPAPNNRPGTQENIWLQKGIQSVEKVPMKASILDSSQVKIAQELINSEEMAARWGNDLIVANWRDIPAELFVGQQLRERYRRVVMGFSGVYLTWIGDFDTSRIRLDVFVSSDSYQAALENMLAYCASISRPLEGVLIPGPAELGPAALALPGHRSQLFWVNRNLFLRLDIARDTERAEGLPITLSEIALRLNDLVDRRVVVSDALPRPIIAALFVAPRLPSVGDLVTVEVQSGGHLVEADVSGTAIIFESTQGIYWYFQATAPGVATIVFTIADPETLLMVERSVQIQVVP